MRIIHINKSAPQLKGREGFKPLREEETTTQFGSGLHDGFQKQRLINQKYIISMPTGASYAGASQGHTKRRILSAPSIKKKVDSSLALWRYIICR